MAARGTGSGSSAISAERWLCFALLALATVVGARARFEGLGDAPWNVDEYYFVRSIEQVLRYGVPRFETGGYYDRGIILQYVTAMLVWFLGSGQMIFRLPEAVLGLSSVYLAYRYARLHLGPGMSALVSAALLLSSWEIEFSRFARMYAGLQFTTLAFLLLSHRAWFADRRRGCYLPHLVALLGMGVHSLSVLLGPLLLVPVIVPALRARFRSGVSQLRFAAVGLATVFAQVAYLQADFRDWGVADSFPEGELWSGGGDSFLSLPDLPIWSIGGGVELDLLILVAGLGLVGGGFLWWRDSRREREMLLWLGLISAVAHQFALVGLFVGLAVVRGEPREILASRRLIAIGLVIGLLFVLWLGFALMLGGVSDSPIRAVRYARRLLFGFPDFYDRFFVPWRDQLPRLGILLAVSVGAQLVLYGRRPLQEVLQLPAAFVLYLAVSMSVLDSLYLTTRYCFSLYPVGLVATAMVSCDLVLLANRRFPIVELGGGWASPLLFALAFVWTDDFHPRHLRAPTSTEITHRMGEFERYEAAWYWRPDFETPSRKVPKLDESDPSRRAIVLNQIPASYYIAGAHAVYVPRDSARFVLVSRERGTVEAWSSLRLLSTPAEVREYTQDASEVWLIRAVRTPVDLEDLNPERLWGDRLLKVTTISGSADGRIETVRVDLSPSGSERSEE